MRKLLLIFLILVMIAGSYIPIMQWDNKFRFYRYQLKAKIHFHLHREAFETIGAEFVVDPVDLGIHHCRPDCLLAEPREYKGNSPEVEELRARDAKQEIQNAKYEPLIEALKFPGSVGFKRRESKETTMPKVSWEAGPLDVTFAFAYFPSAIGVPPPCGPRPDPTSMGECIVNLDDNWKILYSWSNIDDWNIGYDACQKEEDNGGCLYNWRKSYFAPLERQREAYKPQYE